MGLLGTAVNVVSSFNTVIELAMLYSNAMPRYYPHLDNPQLLHMGLTKIDLATWIEPDDDLPHYVTHKKQQASANLGHVYQATERSRPAQQELHNMLLRHLLDDHSDTYQLHDNILSAPRLGLKWHLSDGLTLQDYSSWIADDLLILEEIDNEYAITAASVCSASQWRLKDKFGLAMAQVHQPVPNFNQQLLSKVERFFNHLRPEHVVQRFNWSVQPFDSLEWPVQEYPAPITANTSLYWRVERQSFRRLPATNAIVFSIRVYTHCLDLFFARPQALKALFDAMESYPDKHSRYKNFSKLMPALEKYRASLHQPN